MCYELYKKAQICHIYEQNKAEFGIFKTISSCMYILGFEKNSYFFSVTSSQICGGNLLWMIGSPPTSQIWEKKTRMCIVDRYRNWGKFLSKTQRSSFMSCPLYLATNLMEDSSVWFGCHTTNGLSGELVDLLMLVPQLKPVWAVTFSQ